jgi:hypothetical protein
MSATNLMVSYNDITFWTRNTNCILSSANGYDTTGISVGIVPYGGIGGVLISDRHVLLARHTSAGTTPGSTIYFVNNSNIAFAYTIIDVQPVGPSYGSGYTDIAIGYLNTTVNASLKYYKVFPSDFLDYLQLGTTYPTFQYLNPYLPVFYMDQEKKFLCGDIDGIVLTDALSPKLDLVFSSNVARYNNSELAVGGDSGNIIFATTNGEIVLLGSWYIGSPGTKAIGNQIGVSSYICPHISTINSVMTSLAGSSYSLTQLDLSSLFRKIS